MASQTLANIALIDEAAASMPGFRPEAFLQNIAYRHAADERAFRRKWTTKTVLALALYLTHYNFTRVQKTLRVTPSMETGVPDHVWSLDESSNFRYDSSERLGKVTSSWWWCWQ